MWRWNFAFLQFFRGSKLKFSPFWHDFWLWELKFQKPSHKIFVSPWNLLIWKNLAQSDLRFYQSTPIYAKNCNFSAKCDFPYILYYRLDASTYKTKSFNNWETYDPILERRKIGLQHIWKWTKSILLAGPPIPLIRRVGRYGSVFAYLAHMKVSFIFEQQLFTERS